MNALLPVADALNRVLASVRSTPGSVFMPLAEALDAILITGGTGFSGRDSTPEAVAPLFDKTIDGFGEVFRALSYQEIGSSTVQSRAIAGFANNTVVFCVPGSTGACKTAWNGIIREQLDSTHRPCNFVGVLEVRESTS